MQSRVDRGRASVPESAGIISPLSSSAQRRGQRGWGGRLVLADVAGDHDAEAVIAVRLARVREPLGLDEALLPEAALQRFREPRDVHHV